MARLTKTPEGLLEAVKPAIEAWSVPGIAVGVLTPDGKSQCWGIGRANLQNRQPVTPDTVFQVGSITKVFTATAILQLVDIWRLDLDAPLQQYLPDFRVADAAASSSVTVRHCLTHTGGFWGDDFRDYGRGPGSLESHVQGMKDLRQLTNPGELFAYNNAGFSLLGHLLAKLSGESYERAMQDRVLGPLGLEDTSFRPEDAITRPAAAGYNAPMTGGENKVARPYAIPWSSNPAGAIISTVGDLLKFAAFHLSGETASGKKPLSAGALRAMQETQTPAANMADEWGLGWWKKTYGATQIIGHGGSTNGFRALLTIVPARKFAVAVLTNGSNGAVAGSAVERWALREYLEAEIPLAPAVKMTTKQLQRFAGAFHNPDSDSTISVDASRLRVEAVQRSAITQAETRLPVMHAEPIGPATFRIVDTVSAGSSFDYILDAAGEVRFRRSGGRLAKPGVS